MTLASYGNGSTGFFTRQFAIGDVNDIDFLQFADGSGVAANETSKINLGSPGIYGSSNRFASAADLSQISIGGTVRVRNDITFSVAFLTAVGHSEISFYPSQVVGCDSMHGPSYQCSNSLINKNSVLPGGDVPYADNENCNIPSSPNKISLSVVLADLKAFHAQIGAVRTELAEGTGKTQADLAAVRTELAQGTGRAQADLAAVRTELAQGTGRAQADLAAVRTELAQGTGRTQADLVSWIRSSLVQD